MIDGCLTRIEKGRESASKSLRDDDPFASQHTNIPMLGNSRELCHLTELREKHHWPIQVPSQTDGRPYLLPIETADRCTVGEAVAVVSRDEPIKNVGLDAPDR